LRDEAPDGSVESILPESGHIMQGIWWRNWSNRRSLEVNLRAEREGGSSCVFGFLQREKRDGLIKGVSHYTIRTW